MKPAPPDAEALRFVDEPGADNAAPPLRAVKAVDLALSAAHAAGGTLGPKNAPPRLRGALLDVGHPAGPECYGRLWRWIAWQAGAYEGGILYTDPAGRRIRFRLICAMARNGGYWYASHYDRQTGRTLNVYVGTHRSGAAEGQGLAKGAARIAAKIGGAPSPRRSRATA